jgi:hypothetical protein
MSDNLEPAFKRRQRERAEKQRRIDERSQQNRLEEQNSQRWADVLSYMQGILSQITGYRNEHRTDGKKTTSFVETAQITLLALTVVGTFMTYNVFYNQLMEMKKTHADAVTASNQQHADTTAALGKADTANGISTDTAARQLRAYLGLHAVGPQATIMVSCPDCAVEVPASAITPTRNSLTTVLKNFGATPAYRPRMCSEIEPSLADAEIFLKKLKNDDSKTCAVLNQRFMPTIWPTEERPFGVSMDKRQVMIMKGVRVGKNEAYIVGLIEYRDIFNARRRTLFCHPLFNTDNGCDGLFADDE